MRKKVKYLGCVASIMAAKARNVKLSSSSRSNKNKNPTTSVKKPLKKPVSIEPSADSNDDYNSEEIWHAFEVELKWCVEQLESQLSSKKCNQRQFEDTNRALKVLTNPNAPLIKKRQLMRASFGDYRQKMKEEEMKFKKDMKKMNVSMVDAIRRKGTFLKKSAVLQTHANMLASEQDESCSSVGETNHSSFSIKKSDNSFRFNFSPPDSKVLNENV